LIVDRLEIAAGLDLDNLQLMVDMNSEEQLILLQNLRKHPMKALYEKTFKIKRGD
jgi:hypothetical protein